MKLCPKCNTPCEDNAAFCPECGSPLPDQDSGSQNTDGQGSSQNSGYQNGGYQNTGYQQNNYQQNNYQQAYYQQNNTCQPLGFGITPRSIPLCIIFTLITCGIYGIYWMIKINDEVNLLAGEPQATSGGIVFLLTVVTCGIYGLYWLYKMGERCDRIKGAYGNSGILYLILGLVGFSIISYCLIQDTINKKVG